MEREQKIIRTSWVVIAGNLILAALKLFFGFMSGSFAVIADGIDSTTDIVSSLVVLVAARIITRPPNVRFPYGYRKADTIAAKVLSFMIFFAGAQLGYSTLKIFIEGGSMAVPSAAAIWITVVSIIGKALLALLLFRSGRITESLMLIANAKNMRNDILISVSVLCSLLFTIWLQQPLIDRIIALGISVFIMYVAFRIFMRTNLELMDGIDNTEVYCKLFEAVGKVNGAKNPHRVRARKIGIYYMVSMDIEVDPELTIRAAHEIARKVEKHIKTDLKHIYDVMVHVEPLGNVETDEKFGIRESDIEH